MGSGTVSQQRAGFICRCFTAKVTAHPRSTFRDRGACVNNICGCWTMENVSEGSRLFLAGICCLGLGFKLQTWLCGGEDLRKTAPQNSVRLLLLTGTFTGSLVTLQALFWAFGTNCNLDYVLHKTVVECFSSHFYFFPLVKSSVSCSRAVS